MIPPENTSLTQFVSPKRFPVSVASSPLPLQEAYRFHTIGDNFNSFNNSSLHDSPKGDFGPETEMYQLFFYLNPKMA